MSGRISKQMIVTFSLESPSQGCHQYLFLKSFAHLRGPIKPGPRSPAGLSPASRRAGPAASPGPDRADIGREAENRHVTDTGPLMPDSPTSRPGQSSPPRPAVGSPGPSAVKAGGRPPVGGSRVGSGRPGPDRTAAVGPPGCDRGRAGRPSGRGDGDGSLPAGFDVACSEVRLCPDRGRLPGG
jgi:hypothetical protein